MRQCAATRACIFSPCWGELFFKWIKQNLKITRFRGTSENAIRSQLAVSFIAYILLRLLQADALQQHPPATILLILRTHLFVRRPIIMLLDLTARPPNTRAQQPNQLLLTICN